MSSLNITQRRVGDVVILDLDGKIALGETNRSLHESLRGLAESNDKNVLINLANVTWDRFERRWRIGRRVCLAGKNGGSMKLLNLAVDE